MQIQSPVRPGPSGGGTDGGVGVSQVGGLTTSGASGDLGRGEMSPRVHLDLAGFTGEDEGRRQREREPRAGAAADDSSSARTVGAGIGIGIGGIGIGIGMGDAQPSGGTGASAAVPDPASAEGMMDSQDALGALGVTLEPPITSSPRPTLPTSDSGRARRDGAGSGALSSLGSGRLDGEEGGEAGEDAEGAAEGEEGGEGVGMLGFGHPAGNAWETNLMRLLELVFFAIDHSTKGTPPAPATAAPGAPGRYGPPFCTLLHFGALFLFLLKSKVGMLCIAARASSTCAFTESELLWMRVAAPPPAPEAPGQV